MYLTSILFYTVNNIQRAARLLSYRKLAALFFLVYSLASLSAQEDNIRNRQKKFTVSGYVSDKGNGEMLAGVSVVDTKLKIGASTNSYGFFSLSIPAGKYNLRFSFIGYKAADTTGIIDRDISMNIALSETETRLGEIIIEGKRTDENVRAAEMSLVKLNVKTIKNIPSLLGEIDLIKVIQLLPGVQSTSEGSTGFSVRGGSADQNLIILDEATIYNASHLMGFFSVFNNDAVKDVTLYKGDIPAAYGGRLSSLLDVRMKDGNSKRLGFTGSIGTISSKLTVEGPIKDERTTFLVAGRRTYADLFLPFAQDESVRDNKLYFYDLNLKLMRVINENNRIFLSGYSGRDVFKNGFAGFGFGNKTISIRWNHLFSRKLFFNLSVIYSGYNYELGTPDDEVSSFKWSSELRDYSARFDFTHFLSERHKLRYGITSAYHGFSPGSVISHGSTGAGTDFELPHEYALEHSIYVTDDYKTTGNLTIKYGLRIAFFQNIGPGTYYNYDNEFNPTDSTKYGKGDIFNSYINPEPRVALTYILNEKSSIKVSYSRTVQYITLAQNSTAGTPLDIWFPATPTVKPQKCDLFAIGYFRNLSKNRYEASAELYYKNINNLIDFRDHAQLLLNPFLEGELRFGRGYSYSVEALLRKNDGRLTGWISYTYSRSFRLISEINNGRVYNSPYDKPNTLNLVASYDIKKRLTASLTWVYSTGLPVTFPTGRAIIGNAIIPIYSNRNDYRMPDYHRLDLSVTLKGKEKPGKRWNGELNFSVYNVYNRHNAWSINFVQDSVDPAITYAEKTYLFSVIPALTYNIKF